MKYLFVLGRNPLLSIAEIFAYCEKEGIKITSHSARSNGLLAELDKEINVNRAISELGGSIAIGKVLFAGKIDELLEEIKKKPIYFGRENKVVYSVLNFSEGELLEEVLNAMKINFANERLKARYKGVSGRIKLQSGAIVHGSPEKISLRDMNYFFFEGKDNAFGFIEANSNPEESEKRDIGKPVRRESLAISPRLAKILINLSQVREKETLADPFCGIGIILQESLLKGINVIGIDIDNSAVENAKENVEWLRKNYKISTNSRIICYDSSKYNISETVDGIATEPLLGELMKRVPARDAAIETIRNFEELMIRILKNMRKSMKKGGKIAFTAPLITSNKGKVFCDIERICHESGFRVYELRGSEATFPIREFREGQIVGREIFVLID
jgi:tRNA G10  N-methylase Trm11